MKSFVLNILKDINNHFKRKDGHPMLMLVSTLSVAGIVATAFWLILSGRLVAPVEVDGTLLVSLYSVAALAVLTLTAPLGLEHRVREEIILTQQHRLTGGRHKTFTLLAAKYCSSYLLVAISYVLGLALSIIAATNLGIPPMQTMDCALNSLLYLCLLSAVTVSIFTLNLNKTAKAILPMLLTMFVGIMGVLFNIDFAAVLAAPSVSVLFSQYSPLLCLSISLVLFFLSYTSLKLTTAVI